MLGIFKKKATESSKLSDLVHNAKSRDKKRIYARVIDRAIAEQNAVLERQKKAANSSD